MNQGSQCKQKLESMPNIFLPEKGLFLGHPVIQAVEAKMLGPVYKIFIFLQNIASLKKISHFYPLRAEIIAPPPGLFSFGNRPGSWGVLSENPKEKFLLCT